jgi:hypothetical protein
MNLNNLIKPYSKTHLAKAYGVDLRTFNRWLKPLYKKIGKPNGRLFTPFQVKMIFQLVGSPDLGRLRKL